MGTVRSGLGVGVTALVVLLAVGCGEVGTRKSVLASKTIGPEGGSVTFERVKVDVPPEALADEVTLTIAVSPSPPDGNVGPAYEIDAGDAEFAKAVTITYTVDPGDLTADTPLEHLMLAWVEDGKWSALPASYADVASGTVIGETTHLSVWGAIPSLPEPPCLVAGETFSSADNAKACCDGLDALDNCKEGGVKGCDLCACESNEDKVCVACGDGTCGSGENSCNCPKDCPDPWCSTCADWGGECVPAAEGNQDAACGNGKGSLGYGACDPGEVCCVYTAPLDCQAEGGECISYGGMMAPCGQESGNPPSKAILTEGCPEHSVCCLMPKSCDVFDKCSYIEYYADGWFCEILPKECEAGYVCNDGECVPDVCTPDCGEKECGDDGCGGSCGVCEAGCTCANGMCMGECGPGKKVDGQACAAATECSSGFCVDGVCCSTACDGKCRSCAKPGAIGTCTFYAANTDPSTECGLCKVCDGAGACKPVAQGSDLKNECMANTQESCGFDGMCDGSGVCEFWPVTTVCVQQTCNGSTYYPADYCSGEGQCLEGGSMSCCPYKCWVSKCLTSCATSADCCDGATCVASVCIAGP